MLKLTVKGRELFDESTESFITVKDTVLKLEHSLLSLSKWESKWHKPFLDDKQKTAEEYLDYIQCMCIGQDIDANVLYCLTDSDMKKIIKYIDDPMTATTIDDKRNSKRGSRIVTSELIYCWMVTLQIPFECEKWHLNRLLTLIRVCNIENSPKKRMKGKDILKQNSNINHQRRQMLNSMG